MPLAAEGPRAEVTELTEVKELLAESDNLVRRLIRKVEELTWAAHRLDVAEFHEYFRRPGRILFISFASGLFRGLGIAIGFTLLGALLVLVLRWLIVLNLPGIGQFLAQLIRVINQEMALKP